MSRRKTPHQKREGTRARRALDRAILRAAREMGWGTDPNGKIYITSASTVELVGLVIARNRHG